MRPPTQGVLPEAPGRAGDIPYVENGEPVGAVIIAWSVIEFQPALRTRHRRQVTSDSGQLIAADSLAGAVHVPRPGIGRRRLEPARKAAIHAPLHGMVGRISLAGANMPRTEVRIKTLPVRLPRVDICAQVVSLWLCGAHIGTIEHEFVRKLPLETK